MLEQPGQPELAALLERLAPLARQARMGRSALPAPRGQLELLERRALLERLEMLERLALRVLPALKD